MPLFPQRLHRGGFNTATDNCCSSFPETQACHFPHTKGQCSGQYLRYYYDSVHDKCKKFLYTGCVGNGNRFFDQVRTKENKGKTD
uniref:BPTI/Kunitz inhibitor domain-containing protein n=1 Tax=Myripristis murdjan TaxID=586833 RepID=A0A667YI57_9TELE